MVQQTTRKRRWHESEYDVAQWAKWEAHPTKTVSWIPAGVAVVACILHAILILASILTLEWGMGLSPMIARPVGIAIGVAFATLIGIFLATGLRACTDLYKPEYGAWIAGAVAMTALATFIAFQVEV